MARLEMKLDTGNIGHSRAGNSHRVALRGFTIVEGMVVLGLSVVLIAATLGIILVMQVSSSRVSDYTAAMAIIEAKAEDIRAVYYNPPNYPFTTNSAITITNQDSVALNQAGATFLVPGTVISKIEYKGSMGHLVTITATFQTPRRATTVSLQTFVNQYCGGEQ